MRGNSRHATRLDFQGKGVQGILCQGADGAAERVQIRGFNQGVLGFLERLDLLDLAGEREREMRKKPEI